MLSLDAELLWGQPDNPQARDFGRRYPNAMAAYEHVLRSLCFADMSATWLVVGGLALGESAGPSDYCAAGIPREWALRIPAGNELTEPMWYRRSFIRKLASSQVAQDIGLHGGLTHLKWSGRESTVIRCELEAGIKALRDLGISPASFSFPGEEERHHALLAEHGIRCFRGHASLLPERSDRSLPASLLGLVNEIGHPTPPPIWPRQTLAGLWNIPASISLCPAGKSVISPAGMENRLAQVRRGIDAAVRRKGVLHVSLRPAGLAEFPDGCRLFDEILEQISHARHMGDLSIQNMVGIASCMDGVTERAIAPSRGPASLTHQVIGAGEV